LLEGEHVVISAQFMLDSESKLREAIQKMLNPEPPSAADHNQTDQEMEGAGEDMDDLFADEDESELESLFDEKKE
jgi:Cu(I)/Ag(I) efflux system membrane fusion protein/cobalt-zinc-cadmium efflux system membrane fusion protein